MKRVNVNDFYSMGFAVHPLIEVEEGAVVGDFFLPLANTKESMESLLDHPTYRMRVSREGCRRLLSAVSAIISDDFAQVDFKKKLDWGEAYSIREAAKAFESVLIAELQTLDTYFVDQKGAYSTSDLVERADIMLPETVRDGISALALDDWRQAGRAFVFDLPTAAGFHLMRATESVIRQYYEAVAGKKPKLKQRDWGAYVKALEKCGAEPKVVAAIDQMRSLHRNPLIHPEEVLSEAEAQTLLGIAQSTILAMVGDMEKRKTALPAATP
jgi:hypothetical protein